MKVLSLVVPAYNSEQFLDKCIPSFLVESVLEKLDIIIVNDGSKDATAEVAEKYCHQHPDSVRLISQENKGHGGALNTGFAVAQGKYLKPIDADDWLETQSLPELIRLLENCDSDVILTHYSMIDVSNGEITKMRSYPTQFECALTLGELMADWRNFYRVATFHGIAYRTVFYQEHNNLLTEHVFYEDNEYAAIPFCYAKTITPLNVFVYDYRVGDVNQSIATANQVKRIHHIQSVLDRMIREYLTVSEGPGKEYLALKTQAVGMMYLTTALLAHPDKKLGRTLATELMDQLEQISPKIHNFLYRKYQVYKILSRMHIRKETWESFLKSGFYNHLRKSHPYE